jgi:hypothetical protein
MPCGARNTVTSWGWSQTTPLQLRPPTLREAGGVRDVRGFVNLRTPPSHV